MVNNNASRLRALICTVGQRDLELDGRTALEHGPSVRQFGTEILSKYDSVEHKLAAPILERALNYLSDVGNPPDQLVLIVTDRAEGLAHREGDTCTVGEVLNRLLRARYCLPKKTSIKRLRSVPASLDGVLDELAPWFEQWSEQYSGIYVVTAGGTPAMSTGVLLSALEFCPDKVTPLYVPEGQETRPMNVIHRVRNAQRRRDMVSALNREWFDTARVLVEEASEALDLRGNARRALMAIVSSASERLRFDMESARRSLVRARQEAGLPDEFYSRVVRLQRGLPSDGNPVGLLAELFHNAWHQWRHQDYADFVLRLFNFQQAALRQAAEREGVIFRRKGEFLDPAWLEAAPEFGEYAAAWTSKGSTEGLDLSGGRASGPVLLCLARYLSSEAGLPARVHESADRLQRIVDLRNRCFAAHDFEPVGSEEIKLCFGGDDGSLRDTMKTLYESATGQELPPDPFDETRELANALLRWA